MVDDGLVHLLFMASMPAEAIAKATWGVLRTLLVVGMPLVMHRPAHTAALGSSLRSDTEAKTTLSLVLTLGVLGLMFLLRKLGKVLGDNDRMCASEAALLKQVCALMCFVGLWVEVVRINV